MRRPLCVFCLAFLLFLRVMLSLHPPVLPDYGALDGETVTVRGTITSKEFSISESGRVSLLVRLSGVSLPDRNISIDRKLNIICRFRAEKMEDLEELCDLLPCSAHAVIRGSVRVYEPATNHGEFDSAFYHIGILGDAFEADRAECVSVTREKWMLPEILSRCRRYFAGTLETYLPEKDAALMRAMLLGERSVVPAEIKGLYRESGIIHVLAISGLHVSVMGAGLYELLRRLRLPVTFRAAAAVTVMILYGRMVGTGASTARALVMFTLLMGAKALRRTYDLQTSLAVAGVLLAVQNPLYLDYSGFLFSFAAVGGISVILPSLPQKVKFLAVPMSILPVYLQYNYGYPIGSILINLAVIPLMGILLPAGLLVLSLGTLVPVLAPLPAFLVRLILSMNELLCNIINRIPYQSAVTGRKPGLAIAGYLVILLLTSMLAERIPETIRLILILSAVLITAVPQYYGLQIHFIDVGQGDGILVTLNEEEAVLIDGGSTSRQEAGQYTLLPLLKYYGISELSCMILSHEDSDHMNGWEDIMRDPSIRVGRILLPDIAEEMRGENYRAVLAAAEEEKIPVSYAGRGDLLQLGRPSDDLKLFFLHPSHGEAYPDANNGSSVFWMEYGSFTALFTGDLESGAQEDEVLETIRKLKSSGTIKEHLSLLKIAHHGSEGATGEALLEELRPGLAVISCGRNNVYHHPHKALLDRLEAAGICYRITAREGEISIAVSR